MNRKEKLPLKGVKIIAATTGVAGPYGGMVFADLGAELIRVGRPGRPFFAGWNRNKRNININLRSENGQEIMQKLLQNTDIFFENFAPGVMERFRLSYDTVSKLHPNIIYVSCKGYGEGPYGKRPAWDPCIEAQTGIMDTIRPDSSSPPNRICGPNIDKTTALFCVFVSMAALYNKRKTGKGDHIRCNMFEDAISIQGQNIALYGLYQRLWGQIGPGIGAASCFRVRDRWIAIDASRDRDWLRFCDAFNITEANKISFATTEARDQDPESVNEIMAHAVARRFSYSVIEKLRNVGVPGEMIDTWIEVSTKSTPVDSGNEVLLPLRCSFYNLDSDEEWTIPPKFGENTIEILKELGYTDVEIMELREKKIVSTDKDEKREGEAGA
jgi:crotonobetainyl-CoA:carnitine CoA-transferase CaiB-like acyl-CoA transferase